MAREAKYIAIVAADVPARTKPSNYPEPFASRMTGREKRSLGDLFGLTNFGVNLTKLAPNASSSLRHAHTKQDEFIYVLQGRPTLHTDEGRTALSPGMCAGFKAGTGNGHHLINESADLKRLVKSPVFSAQEQVKALDAVLDKAGISGIAANFIRLVASKRRLFVLSDMTIEVHEFPAGRVIGFNGVTEWALDSVEQEEALWLPAEGQLRDLLGGLFRQLRREDDETWAVVYALAGTERMLSASTAEEAYGLALLDVLLEVNAGDQGLLDEPTVMLGNAALDPGPLP